MPVACSFYEGANDYSVENNYFTLKYRNSSEHEKAQILLQGLTNCFDRMKDKYVNLNLITPFGNTWRVIAGEPNTWWSTDYERISIPNDFNYSISQASVSDGKCSDELAAVTPHELTHLLFANTVLQHVYDFKNELPYPKIGSSSFGEGMANYVAYDVTKNNLDADNWFAELRDRCGTDRLLDPQGLYYPGATQNQMLYSEVLEGRGFKKNSYDAGFCFFNRIEKNCGEGTVKELFGTALAWDGMLQPHPTIFYVIKNQCGQQRTEQIMSDFGIDLSLIDVDQRFPQNGFKSGIASNGCL